MLRAPATAPRRIAAAQSRETAVIDDETALAEADLGNRAAFAGDRGRSHSGQGARELLLTFRARLRLTTGHTTESIRTGHFVHFIVGQWLNCLLVQHFTVIESHPKAAYLVTNAAAPHEGVAASIP